MCQSIFANASTRSVKRPVDMLHYWRNKRVIRSDIICKMEHGELASWLGSLWAV